MVTVASWSSHRKTSHTSPSLQTEKTLLWFHFLLRMAQTF